MESTAPKTLTFKVARKAPELIPPAKPTPHELKPLSEIDNQVRFLARGVHFYRRSPSMEGKDPARVIKDALARALVFYYPFAGRLRERAAGKMVVECTGEGIMFVEADADVALLQFGDPLHPPFPCVDELLYDVQMHASTGVLGSPLMFIQVTRLKCGGFTFAIHVNHTMCDAAGHAQFLAAVGELARGAGAPSIPPVWDRHLINMRSSPRANDDDDGNPLAHVDDMVLRSFFFGSAELATLQSHLPPHLRSCSRFELLTACLWRCRTVAFSPEPHEEVRLSFVVDIRRRLNLPLPAGYYGNAFVTPVAIAAAGDLAKNPLRYAVELLRNAKADLTEERLRSMPEIGGHPRVAFARSYEVSDLTRAGFQLIDFGWGTPVYGGHPEGCAPLPATGSFLIPSKNNKGENAVMVTIRLPPKAMVVFAEELERMLGGSGGQVKASKL